VCNSRFVLCALVLGIVVCSNPAKASTGIALSSSQASTISFSPIGPLTPGNQNVSITFSAPFSSSNSAAGLGALLGFTGFYTVTGGPVDLHLVSSIPGLFAIYSAANTTLSFSTNSAPDGSGTDLLSGTLRLVDLSEIFGSGHTDDFGVANMTITGGIDEGFFPGDVGIARFNIDLSSAFLPDLSGTFKTNLTNGCTLDPAPELDTLVLSGTSLILLGGLLRRLRTRQGLG
jgi:hypothetical protein